MKTKDILEWVVGESINGEFLNFVNVPEEGESEGEQNEEWWITWCGGCPPFVVPSGKYLYFYESNLGVDAIVTRFGTYVPDVTIEVGYNEHEQAWEYMYLYKVEE